MRKTILNLIGSAIVAASIIPSSEGQFPTQLRINKPLISSLEANADNILLDFERKAGFVCKPEIEGQETKCSTNNIVIYQDPPNSHEIKRTINRAEIYRGKNFTRIIIDDLTLERDERNSKITLNYGNWNISYTPVKIPGEENVILRSISCAASNAPIYSRNLKREETGPYGNFDAVLEFYKRQLEQ